MGFNPRDVLIDVRTAKVYLAESPEGAYRQAAAEGELGPFHLMRVGDRAGFRSRRLAAVSGGGRVRVS
jgi:hypothetical protein